jgi:hypothetical protein
MVASVESHSIAVRLNVPIKSYLAHAVEGQRDELARTLRALEGCAVIPATNRGRHPDRAGPLAAATAADSPR